MKLIGYVGHNTTLKTSASRTARLRNINDQVLRRLIAENLESLRQIIEWNIEHQILYYRITSGLVPYASHKINRLGWAKEYSPVFDDIGCLLQKTGMLVAMHPGQYTVLSSPDQDVVRRSLEEIEYHNTVLDLLKTGSEAKITVHLGGSYTDKKAAIGRWMDNFRLLSDGAKRRLAIENDEKVYTISDCLLVHTQTGVPVVFDYFHHQLNPDGHTYLEALEKCLTTWTKQHEKPEVHFSTQAPDKRPGAHAASIDTNEFMRFYQETEHLDFNILLETKDKELSVLKVMQLLF